MAQGILKLPQDPVIKGVGGAIFLTSLLGPGVLMAKDVVKGVVSKWREEEADSDHILKGNNTNIDEVR